jgi:methylaspartate mutase epsilon subunit
VRMPDDEFLKRRRQLFRHAPVEPFDLGQSVEALRRSASRRLTVAETLKRADHVLIQPRSGVSDHAAMVRLLRALEHADIGSVTIDSYTRLNLWDKARTESHLNGYPLVTSGVANGRDLVDAVSIPLEVRHGSPNGCLLAETAFASGITSFEGGGISYNLPYCKQVPLAESLRDWQYVDRLTGWLSAAAGVALDRETFGTLTAVLVPPSISIVVSVLEMLLAVEEGVRCVTISYPESGCLFQDVAAIGLIPEIGCRHVRSVLKTEPPALATALHQWMGVFPTDRRQAIDLIGYGVLAGVAGGATKLINKTYEEAIGLPSLAANADSIRYCKDLVAYCGGHPEIVADLRASIDTDVADERDLIEQEVEEMLAAVYELGTDDLAAAVSTAFAQGLLDIPFPASQHVRGQIVPARDAHGAIRYQSYGRLPVSTQTRRRNHDQLGSKRAFSYQGIMRDIFYMAAGESLRDDQARRAVLDQFYRAGNRCTSSDAKNGRLSVLGTP